MNSRRKRASKTCVDDNNEEVSAMNEECVECSPTSSRAIGLRCSDTRHTVASSKVASQRSLVKGRASKGARVSNWRRRSRGCICRRRYRRPAASRCTSEWRRRAGNRWGTSSTPASSPRTAGGEWQPCDTRCPCSAWPSCRSELSWRSTPERRGGGVSGEAGLVRRWG